MLPHMHSHIFVLEVKVQYTINFITIVPPETGVKSNMHSNEGLASVYVTIEVQETFMYPQPLTCE